MTASVRRAHSASNLSLTLQIYEQILKHPNYSLLFSLKANLDAEQSEPCTICSQKRQKKKKNFLTPPDSQKKMLTLQPWKKPLARKMNRKATKRHIASWVLLAVFLPMMVFSSLHVHSNGQCSEVQCAECVNHMPHSGHFMAQDSPMHSCVLCQFLSLPFLAAAAMVVAICYTPKHTVNTANRCNVCIALRGSVALRAPPFV